MKTYKVTVDSNGTIRWYNENGQPHREEGPAIEWANGTKSWWLRGQPHREDGPAIERADGDKFWWLRGQRLTEEDFNQRTTPKEMTVEQISKLLGYKIKIIKG
jgi:hypothetical protein